MLLSLGSDCTLNTVWIVRIGNLLGNCSLHRSENVPKLGVGAAIVSHWDPSQRNGTPTLYSQLVTIVVGVVKKIDTAERWEFKIGEDFSSIECERKRVLLLINFIARRSYG